MKEYKFLKIQKSQNKDKKYEIFFEDLKNNKIISVHFGDDNFQQYINHRDKTRRDAYISRHKGIINKWNVNNVISPAFLSLYILWVNQHH